RGGHRRSVPTRANGGPQGSDRSQSSAAEAARHSVERDDRGGFTRGRQARAGRVPRGRAGWSGAEVKLVDSHCHLDDKQFAGDREAVIERARAAGVERLMAIGTGDGPPDLETAVRLAAEYPFFYATVGVHPHDAAKAVDESFDQL